MAPAPLTQGVILTDSFSDFFLLGASRRQCHKLQALCCLFTSNIYSETRFCIRKIFPEKLDFLSPFASCDFLPKLSLLLIKTGSFLMQSNFSSKKPKCFGNKVHTEEEKFGRFFLRDYLSFKIIYSEFISVFLNPIVELLFQIA